MEKAKSQQKFLPPFTNDNVKDEATVADEEKGLGAQYEELKVEKQDKVNVYEKLQSADNNKAHTDDTCEPKTPANSDYQELQIQDKPNQYATVNHGNNHQASNKLQEGEIKCEYEVIGGHSPDPNYQQLQKTGISKPSVYETVAPGGKASSTHEDVTRKVLTEELPLQSNKTCNPDAPDSGGSERDNLDPRLSEEIDGVPSTPAASTDAKCLEVVDISPSKDRLESNLQHCMLANQLK